MSASVLRKNTYIGKGSFNDALAWVCIMQLHHDCGLFCRHKHRKSSL